MTRMTGPDCVVRCNLINTYIHTYIHIYIHTYIKRHTETPDKNKTKHSEYIHVFDPIYSGANLRLSVYL